MDVKVFRSQLLGAGAAIAEDGTITIQRHKKLLIYFTGIFKTDIALVMDSYQGQGVSVTYGGEGRFWGDWESGVLIHDTESDTIVMRQVFDIASIHGFGMYEYKKEGYGRMPDPTPEQTTDSSAQ